MTAGTVWDAARASEILARALPRYLDDLRALVSIDSGTFDKWGVDAVGRFLRERYEALGAVTSIHEQSAYGDTQVIRLTGRGSGSILLLGHTDTVYPAGTAVERPFRIDGERAFGPGISDMKAGDLSMVYALEALAAGAGEFGRVTIVHNSDEEVGSPTSKDIIRQEAERHDAVLVLEAGRENGDLVSARKGIADFEITVRGVSAHAGVNHDLGRSAALEVAHLVLALEGLNGTIPGVTVNVGRVEAGDRTNVVPHTGYLRLEARAFQREYLEEVIEAIERIAGTRTVAGTEASIATRVNHWPMYRGPGTEALLAVARGVASELGVRFGDVATGGASDGNTAAQAGRPVLDGLGPIGGAAHSPDEYLLVPSIVPRTALLAGLIARVSSAPWGHGGAEGV